MNNFFGALILLSFFFQPVEAELSDREPLDRREWVIGTEMARSAKKWLTTNKLMPKKLPSFLIHIGITD